MKRSHLTILLVPVLLAGGCSPSAIPRSSGSPLTPPASPTPVATSKPPQKEAIVFAGSDGSGNTDIYIAEGFDAAPIRLTQPAAGASSTDGNYDPAWSPDGTEIAFASWVSYQVYQLTLMERDGSQVRRIMDSGCGRQPRWSPDGRKIAFVTCGESGGNIAVMDADGEQFTLLTSSGNAVLTRPDWSPDGRYIVFSGKNTDGTDSLYVMGADGSNLSRLEQTNTPNKVDADSPSWSPDGQSIAWLDTSGQGSINDCKTQLMLLDVNAASAPKVLVGSGTHLDCSMVLTWSPDGKKLLVLSNVFGALLVNPDGSIPSSPLGNNAALFRVLYMASSIDWFMPGLQPFAGTVTVPASGQGISQDFSDLMRVCSEGATLASQPAYAAASPPHPLAAFLLKRNTGDWVNANYPGVRLPQYSTTQVQLVACIQESHVDIEPCYYSATGEGAVQKTIPRGIQRASVEILSARTGEEVDSFNVDGPSAQGCPPTVSQYESPNLNGGPVNMDQVYPMLDKYYYEK